jgi:Glycosyltransferase family 87
MSPDRPAVWRLAALALVLAYVLTDLFLAAGDLPGASDDLVPQWVLAHLAVTGHRAGAYDYDTQVAFMKAAGLPPNRLAGVDQPHMRGIGVCPYPPTFAVLYAPVGLLPFDQAALFVYFASVALALIAAWAIGDATAARLTGLPAALALPLYSGVQALLLNGQQSQLTMTLSSFALAGVAAAVFGQVSGRGAGMLTAAVVILCYPGTEYALHLGQNSHLTLALWALGWRAFVRRCDVTAGLWWGLLAYKVHWLLAVGWVPVVTRRPRVLFGMAASAGSLAVAATIVLGFDAWGRWLATVAAIDRVYALDPMFRASLLPLGCDLRSISMRFLPPGVGRYAGWAALAAVAGLTAIWYRRRPAADPAGVEGPGLLFASGLTAAHLYYYDETVFVLPLLVLWSFRAALAWWQFAALIVLTAGYCVAVRYMVAAGPLAGPPWWTVAVIALWLSALMVRR